MATTTEIGRGRSRTPR